MDRWRWYPMLLALIPAMARPADSVAVVGAEGCGRGSLAANVRALRAALRIRMGDEVQSEERTALPLGGLPKALTDAERLLASGRFDYFQVAFDRAERALTAAEADLMAVPPTDRRWEALREVYALQAVIAGKLNRQAEADAYVRRILRVEPNYRPDPRSYPPSFSQVVERLRTELKAAPVEQLTVRTRPEGVPVFVDGKRVGKSPATMNVVPSEYRVEAAFSERKSIPRRVRVGGPTEVELDYGFEGAVAVDQGPCMLAEGGREDRLAMLVRLASLFGARAIIAVREVEPGGGERYLLATVIEGGSELREGKVKLFASGPAPGSMDKLAEFLTTGEVAPGVEPLRGAAATRTEPAGAVTTVSTDAAPTGRSPLKIAGWAGVGLGAVLGGAAGYLAYSANQTQGEIQRLINAGGAVPADQVDAANQLQASGAAQARAGLWLAVAAGALIAAGGALVVFVPTPGGGGDGVAVTVAGRF